jgi:hypothetical protein
MLWALVCTAPGAAIEGNLGILCSFEGLHGEQAISLILLTGHFLLFVPHRKYTWVLRVTRNNHQVFEIHS